MADNETYTIPNNFDVWENKSYQWTQPPDPEAGIESVQSSTPYVILIEYENRTDLAIQKMLYIHRATIGMQSRTIKPTFKELYKGLYTTVATGRSMRLPYISNFPFTLESRYALVDTKGDDTTADKLLKVRSDIYDLNKNVNVAARDIWKAAAKGEQGLIDRSIKNVVGGNGDFNWWLRSGIVEGVQSVKKWQSAETSQFETKFNLINSNNRLALNHYYFIRHCMRALAPSFPNTLEVRTPYLYEIYIPSMLHIPLGFIGRFKAEPKGITRLLKGGSNTPMLMPDAWEISMTFNSLFPISKQMLDLIDQDPGTNFGFTVTSKDSKSGTQYETNTGYDQFKSALPDSPKVKLLETDDDYKRMKEQITKFYNSPN